MNISYKRRWQQRRHSIFLYFGCLRVRTEWKEFHSTIDIFPIWISLVKDSYKTFTTYKDVIETFTSYKRRLWDIRNVQKTPLRHSHRTEDVFETFSTFKRRLWDDIPNVQMYMFSRWTVINESPAQTVWTQESCTQHPSARQPPLGFIDIALGFIDIALGFIDIALGFIDIALGFIDIALGFIDIALGFIDIALGFIDIALGFIDIALGFIDIALGFIDIALGFIDIALKLLRKK